MTLVAMIADTHYGVRNDDKNLLNTQSKFMSEVFFPKIDSLKIKEVVHLGDLFDRRKYVNFLTAKACRETFVDPISARNLKVTQIIGNHDDYYRNTNEFNSPSTLYRGIDGVSIVTEPGVYKIGGVESAVIPWVCDQTLDATTKLLKSRDGVLCYGHLELAGFDMHKGQPSEHGADPNLYVRFDKVFSGHFHTRSTKGNINYLGSTSQYTWADFDDPKGFHVLNTESGEVTFFENPFRDFDKVYINSVEDIKAIGAIGDSLKPSTFMKIVVSKDIDRSLIDDTILALEKNGVADLQIINDAYDTSEIEDEDSSAKEYNQDTLTLLESVIDNSDCQDKSLAKDLVRRLYEQSHEIM